MTGLRHDLSYALRLLRKSPGFTAVAAGTLALGIAASTVVFSAVDGFLLRPLPIQDPSGVVLLKQTAPPDQAQFTVTWPDYQDWQRLTTAFSSFGSFQIDTFNLAGGLPGAGDAERVRGCHADSGLFRTLGLQPLRGRLLQPGDDVPGAPRVVVLNDTYWQRRFQRAPEILGSTLRIDGVPHTVVGIYPNQARIPMGFNDIYVSIDASALARVTRGSHFLGVLARLAPGRTLAQARSELSAAAARLSDQFPQSNRGWGVAAVPLAEVLSAGPRRALIVLSAAVGLVLLICCANLANLLLARGCSRTREIAVRGALGASPLRLFRQLIVESLVLGLAGLLGSLLLAFWGVDALNRAIPPVMQPAGGIGIDASVLVFSAVLSLLTVILFGSLPAVRLLRHTAASPLQAGSRSTGSGPAQQRLSSALVSAEIGFAVLLLSCAGLFIASVVRLQAADSGYRPEGVLTAEIAIKTARLPDPQRQVEQVGAILDRAASLPGVTAAAAVNFPPMTSSAQRGYAAEGRIPPPGSYPPSATYFPATPTYLDAIGISLSQGRFFTVQDGPSAEPVAVVNQTLARIAFPGSDPLGRHIALYSAPGRLGPWMRVVGVVGDTRHFSPASPPTPSLYVPLAQHPEPSLYLVLRTSGDPAALAVPLRDAVRSIDPDLPLNLVRTMHQVMADGIAPARVTTGMMSVFAFLALGLAAFGLYGVISFLVAARTHEFGVRLALGATSADLLRLVLRRAALLTGLGAAFGFAAALAAARLFRSLLFELIRPEPLAFAAVAMLLAAVAMAAAWIPLRRALSLDPVRALRVE